LEHFRDDPQQSRDASTMFLPEHDLEASARV
jgi:hypothetical protein